MRTGLTISGIGHAAALLWAVVTFGIAPHDAMPTESMPVDIISVSDFTKMSAGQKNAPKEPAPKPMVEKIGQAKPIENEAAKVSDKPEIITASAAAAQPESEPKPPEPKPAPPKAKPDPKPPEAEKKPDPKPDPVAEAPKKDTKKPEPKKEAEKKPAPAPKKPTPQFDPANIEQKLALLDKREARRQAYAGETLSSTPRLGSSTGNAPQLSMDEMQAVKACIDGNWTVPDAILKARTQVEVIFALKPDGSLSAEPQVVNRNGHPLFQIAAENAVRAVRLCAPFSFLPVAKYDAWKEMQVNFDPQDKNRT
jgi:hypothetical protein